MIDGITDYLKKIDKRNDEFDFDTLKYLVGHGWKQAADFILSEENAYAASSLFFCVKNGKKRILFCVEEDVYND